jgi:FkbM family methyltransferase
VARLDGSKLALAMVRQSLTLDLRWLLLGALPLALRLRFLAAKYLALARLALGREAVVPLGPLAFRACDLSALGTLQSMVVDFHAEVVRTGVVSRPDPVLVDVGANVGQFAVVAKLFFPGATLHAFEPDPQAFGRLEANVGHLKGVHLHNVGVGEREERRPFYGHPLSVMSSFEPPRGTQPSSVRELPVRPLDDIGLPGPIDLLKVDVEGHELHVLRGARRTLRDARHLLLELSLERGSAQDTNLALLAAVREQAPRARIRRFGRPLGPVEAPAAQDVLIELDGQR